MNDPTFDPKKMLQGKDLEDYLDSIERAGMNVTRQWYGVWSSAVQYMWGEQLAGIKRNPDWDYIVVNYIYPLVMQSIAKLSKNSPHLICRSWNEEETDWAEQWQGLLQYVCEQVLHMPMEVVRAMLDSAVYGYAVGKTYWEPKPLSGWDDQRKMWVGEVRHRMIHPCSFWVDPRAERVEEAESCGTVRKVALEWAMRQWPEHADEIKAHAGDADELRDYEYADGWPGYGGNALPVYTNQRAGSGRMRGYWSRFVSLILGQDAGGTETVTANTGDRSATQYVWVRETYFRDPSIEKIKIEDHATTESLLADGTMFIDPMDQNQAVRWKETGEPVKQEEWPQVVREQYDKPRFPKGRCVIRVGKVVVNEKPEQQVYRRARWPFNVLQYHMLPHMWQGSNAVEMARSSQDMLNVTVAYLTQHLKMTACPQKVVELGTLAKDKKGKTRIIKDTAGEMIVVNQGKLSDIQNLQGNQLDPSVWKLVQYLMQDLETQTFMHPISQGKQNRGKLTATESARLDTNANDLISMRAMLLEYWYNGTGQAIAQVVQENYDEGRRIRIIGWTGDTKPAKMTDEMRRVEFDLEVESGTTMPFDEERDKQNYLLAYKLCADPNLNPMLEECLRKLDISNREKVLTRHAQVQLFRQFLAISSLMGKVQQRAQQAGPEQIVGPDGQPMANPGHAAVQQQLILTQQQIVQKVMALIAQAGQVGQPQNQQKQLQGAA
jgi:hypothetical protein